MVSLRDLASLTGYSVATVSKALREDPTVRPEIRTNIQKLADEHHYRPNHVVRGVFTGRTGQVAVIVSNVDGDPMSRLVGELIDAFAEYDLATLVYNAHRDPDREAQHIHNAIGFRVSGLVLLPADLAATEKHFHELREHRIPFLVMAEYASAVNVPHVHGDDGPAAAQLADHLLALGHRRFGIVAAELDKRGLSSRVDGFLAALERGGVELEEEAIVGGGWNIEDGRLAAGQLLDQPAQRRPTAIFAVTDTLAVGVYQAAQERGLRVPEDLSVIGFGNAGFSRVMHPTLTTVENRHDDFARETCRVLRALMELPSLDRIPESLRDVAVPRGPVLRGSTHAVSEQRGTSGEGAGIGSPYQPLRSKTRSGAAWVVKSSQEICHER